MDNLQTSKFKIDLKTMIYIGSLLVSGMTMYFTFMSELDSRFAALEGSDKDLMVEIDKRLTDLENKFTPIGDGVYTVDPNSTWPPSRGEYKMKDEMSRNKILVLEKELEELKEDLEKLEDKVNK
jgi:tetrahydromethanopterin S-methyltransferase subunit G